MLQGTVRQIKIMSKFILHQNAKFSTRQYFRLYGRKLYIMHMHSIERAFDSELLNTLKITIPPSIIMHI